MSAKAAVLAEADIAVPALTTDIMKSFSAGSSGSYPYSNETWPTDRDAAPRTTPVSAAKAPTITAPEGAAATPAEAAVMNSPPEITNPAPIPESAAAAG
ncbi:hypothetical protein GCM10009851_40450 [Herbiconiux moechotypicola]|uniref:Uncharacterized protein n=1 Tax=Herbiconiux moechotypicola TaxID=637393 RepID=A0ABN3E8P0_9MICO